MLDIGGIVSRNNCKTLSGGQKKLVSLARAAVLEPRLLLLDEPTNFLDAAAKARVMAMVDRLRRETGVTVVQVTHEPDMFGAASSIMELYDGRIA
jgi:ABC-type lipoprotein export system ATPase subunit